MPRRRVRYAKRWWMARAVPSHSPEQKGTLQYVSSLTDGVKRIVTPLHSGGQFTKAGIYATAWNAIAPAMHRPSCSQTWTDAQITWRQSMLAFKARWGQLWNQKLAHRYGRAPTPNCPLCGEPDSVGHLLGGCTHRECVAMKIERHNAAVRMVHDTITRNSKQGGCYTIMDACPANNLPEGVQGTRLPPWLLPNGHPAADELQKCRPDILIIEGLPAAAIAGKGAAEIRAMLHHSANSDSNRESLKIKLHLLEVGYCGDTRHAERDQEKQEQHARLLNILTLPHTPTSGGPTADPPFKLSAVVLHPPITLGRTGTLPTSLIATLKGPLQVPGPDATACATRLHRHAVHYVERMYEHRTVCLAKPGAPPRHPAGQQPGPMRQRGPRPRSSAPG